MDISNLLGDDLMGFCLGKEATAVEDDHVDHLLLAAYELLDCTATELCSGTADAGSQQLLPLPPTMQPRPPLLCQGLPLLSPRRRFLKRESAIPEKTKTHSILSVYGKSGVSIADRQPLALFLH